jgi:hypothetical protein
MKLHWQIDDNDILKVKLFYNSQKNSVFVLNRIDRNIKKNLPEFSKDRFWEAIVSCLITTQQRSGPKSHVTRFICTKPFPLEYFQCRKWDNLHFQAEEIITEFGGLRRGKTIGLEVKHNLQWLESGGWRIVNKIVNDLNADSSPVKERRAAEIIIDNMMGFGPKQSRNLLQSLGLTKYEIPVDSRITKWLTQYGFPLKLSSTALSDSNYYNLVLDGFQKLCEVCEIFPCALDAAIFSSFDEGWSKDNIVW